MSFIFRDGEVIHFRCHPGYVMHGHAIVHCVNNHWTHPAPKCVPILGYRDPTNYTMSNEVYDNRNFYPSDNTLKHLFNWNDERTRYGVYGDGPRRLPLINGIWPSQDQVEQVLTLGPQSTPGPQTMIKEEIDIAELRHRQLEELKRKRNPNQQQRGQRRKNRKNANSNSLDNTVPQETIVGLGAMEDGQVLSVSQVNADKRRPKERRRHHRRGNRRHRNKKRVQRVDPGYSNFITSRTSRVNNGGMSNFNTRRQLRNWWRNNTAELRRRPVEQVQQENITHLTMSAFDATCVEDSFGRSIPKLAPQVEYGYVYHYETKKNMKYPFNSYMEVRYRCFRGFRFANPAIETLLCRRGRWVGIRPECVERIARG